MGTDDLLCEAPGPGGLSCTLPRDHGGRRHEFEITLPANVAMAVAAQMDRMEEARRRMNRAKFAMFFATALNLFAFLFNLIPV